MNLTKGNDTLFRLIHSMDRGEKRFFNLYCSRYKNAANKNYLKLFNELATQAVYDNERLKKTFKGSQLHVTKNYLYNLILEVLSLHHTSGGSNLQRNLSEIKILYEKELFDLAEKLILKVRGLAQIKNDFPVVLETLKMEKRIINVRIDALDQKKIAQIRKLEEQTCNFYKEVEIYFELAMEIKRYHFVYSTIQKEKDKKEFAKIAQRKLFKNISAPKALLSKYFLYNAREFYFFTQSDFKAALVENTRAIRLLTKNPQFERSNPQITATNYTNQISIASSLGKHKIAVQSMEELEAFLRTNPSIEVKGKLLIAQNAILHIYINTGKKAEGIQLLERMTANLNQLETTPDNIKEGIYFNAACLYFIHSEFRKVVPWLNKILNSLHLEKNKSTVYYYARIMELIIFLELKEYDMLGYKIKSFIRFSTERNSPGKLDNLIIHFLRRIIKENKPYQQRNLRILLTDFKQLMDTLGHEPTTYFDLGAWVESKITQKPFSEIVLAKMKKKII